MALSGPPVVWSFICLYLSFQGSFQRLSKCCRSTSPSLHFSKVSCPCSGFLVHYRKKKKTNCMKECAFFFFLYLSPEEGRPDWRKRSSRQTATVAETRELGKNKADVPADKQTKKWASAHSCWRTEAGDEQKELLVLALPRRR